MRRPFAVPIAFLALALGPGCSGTGRTERTVAAADRRPAVASPGPAYPDLPATILLAIDDARRGSAKGEFLGPVDEPRVAEAGIRTGLAQWCGLDWQRLSFEPFMREVRDRGQRRAAITILHGVTQGRFHALARDSGACPDSLRRYLTLTLDTGVTFL